jgi:ubiquinone biosynthesis protein UbiJ
MLDTLVARPLNHLLAGNGWALSRLRPFAGRRVRIECAPFTLALGVRADGQVEAAPDGEPDVTLRLSPGVAMRLAARDETAWKDIETSGDTEFAEALNYVFRNLRWDAEEDLARVFGDIAAHRMVQSGETLRRWGEQATDNLARSFAEYWTEEQPLIARADDIERFNRDVDRLRDDIARLEKRLAILLDRPDAGSTMR